MYHFRSNPPSRAIKPRPAQTPSARALCRLEDYMEETGTAPSSFSRRIMGDSGLVNDLRAGRQLGDAALARIDAFFGEAACA